MTTDTVFNAKIRCPNWQCPYPRTYVDVHINKDVRCTSCRMPFRVMQHNIVRLLPPGAREATQDWNGVPLDPTLAMSDEERYAWIEDHWGPRGLEMVKRQEAERDARSAAWEREEAWRQSYVVKQEWYEAGWHG